MTQTESSQSSEFDRFKDFARRIVAVPKSEIDNEEAKIPSPQKRLKKKQNAAQ